MKKKYILTISLAMIIGLTGCSSTNVKSQITQLGNNVKKNLGTESSKTATNVSKPFNVKEFNSEYKKLIQLADKTCKDLQGGFEKKYNNTRYLTKKYQREYGMTRNESGSIVLFNGTCYKDGKLSEFKANTNRLEANIDIVKKSISELESYKNKKNQVKTQKANKYIEEYNNGIDRVVTLKELCESKIVQSAIDSGYEGNVSWSKNSNSCWFNPKHNFNLEKASAKYNALKSYILANASKVKKDRQDMANITEAKTKANFEAIKKSGRVYAGLVMDTTMKQNGLNYKNLYTYKYADMPVEIFGDKNDKILKIEVLDTVSKQKFNKIASSINKKYVKVSSKRDINKVSLEQVKINILNLHNSQARPNQAAYDRDIRNAKPIKTVIDTKIYKNKGDRITLLKYVTTQGNKKEYMIKVTYLSKSIAEQQQKHQANKVKKAKTKAKKVAKQVENF